MIQSFELKEDAESGDLVYWHGTPRGKFSIKSAIMLMKNESEFLNEDCWDMVWTAPIQQRQRAFLWLTCHDRLMDNNNRFKRKLTDDPKCFICGHDVESSIHVLRDCPAASMVWKEIGGIAFTPEFVRGDIKQWITYNLAQNAQGDWWPTMFGITVWWLWRWRNSRVFEPNPDLPVDQVAFLQVRFNETKRVLLRLEDDEPYGSNQKKEIFC